MIRLAFWFIVCALFIWGTHEVSGQDAADVFRDSQSSEYEWTDNERQDWLMYHMASMFDAQAERIEALQEDVREIRSQNAWILRLLAGGGGVGVLGGAGAVARKRKRNGGG